MVFFPRMSRVTTSEVIILMGTLVFITLVGNLLVVCNMFHLVQGTDTNNFITMSCYHVPIIYNLFLPAILGELSYLYYNKCRSSCRWIKRIKKRARIRSNKYDCISKTCSFSCKIEVSAFIFVNYNVFINNTRNAGL